MHLYVKKKNQIKQIKSANDLTRNKILTFSEKILAIQEYTFSKISISSKYKSLLNYDTWGNDVLPELNNSSQIIDSNIPDTNYLDIQKDNILEHSFFMKNGCNWFGPHGICDQLKFYLNQIKFLSLSVKNKTDKVNNLINSRICVDHCPIDFIQILMTYVMQLQKYIWNFFRTTQHGCRRMFIKIQV